MSKWEEKRLGDICEFIDGDRGANYPQRDEFLEDGHCLFLNTGNVSAKGFDFSVNQFISAEKDNILRKGKLSRGDIVLTTRGTVGNLAYYGNNVPYENVRINSGMVIIRNTKDLIEGRYLYQYLKAPMAQTLIKLYSSGSAQPQLPIRDLKKIKVLVPDVFIQKRVAEIISTYDNLIENNNKRIKILEQMAENLYKEWFVRFRFPGYEDTEFENGLPKGWVYCYIENLASVLQRGISPVYDEDGEYSVINQKCIRTAIMDMNEAQRQSKKYKIELNLQDGDTVICSTGTGTLGRVGQVYGKYNNTTFDSHVTLARTNNIVGKHYFYYALKKLQPWFMNMGIGSTNQQELYIKTIKRSKILVSNNQELNEKFESYAQHIHDEILVLIKKNQNLIKQRDLLLPRLMSGKLEV